MRAELSAAIRAGNVQQIRDLLSRNATSNELDINAPSLTGAPSLLTEAVASLRAPVVRLLLQAGAQPNGVPGEVAAPMTVAALQGRLDVVQQLISAGGSAEINDGAPLYAVCAGTSGSAVAGAKLLLNTGVDCNNHPARCATPLTVAVNRGKVALVRVLLKAGADPNRQSTVVGRNGERPLHVAVRNGSAALVKLLLKYGAEPSLSDGDGVTPLHLAVRLQRDTLRAMLSSYACNSTPTPRGETRRPTSRKFHIGRNFLAIPWRK